jgi:hypothetical protein
MPEQKKKSEEQEVKQEPLPTQQKRDSGYWLARSFADADARTHTALDAWYAEAGKEHWHP